MPKGRPKKEPVKHDAITVSSLMALLSRCDPDTIVVVDGMNATFLDATHVTSFRVERNGKVWERLPVGYDTGQRAIMIGGKK